MLQILEEEPFLNEEVEKIKKKMKEDVKSGHCSIDLIKECLDILKLIRSLAEIKKKKKLCTA